MSTKNTWKIQELERLTEDGYVFTAHYTVSADDGTYTSGAYGSVNFEKPETLIPFKDLTEDQVIGWVKERIGGAEKVAEVEAQLQMQINEQKAPTKSTGVPWS